MAALNELSAKSLLLRTHNSYHSTASGAGRQVLKRARGEERGDNELALPLRQLEFLGPPNTHLEKADGRTLLKTPRS